MSNPLTWVNGEPCDQVSVLDRGFAYGDGLFETLLFRDNQIVFFASHLARLSASAEALKISFPVNFHSHLQRFIAAINATGIPTGVIKLTLTRGSGGRGYSPPDIVAPTYIFSWFPNFNLPSANNTVGVALFRCTLPLPIKSALAEHKTLNRLDNVVARAEFSGSRFAEGLMFDFEGRAVEGTMTNLFWVKNGKLFTPPLAGAGVHGIMRAQIMLRFDTNCISTYQDDLFAADELFMCNSVNGIWPVTEFQQKRWRIGPLTLQIQQEFPQFL